MLSPGLLFAPLGAIPPPSVKAHRVRLPRTVYFPYPQVHEGLFSCVIPNRPWSNTNTQWPQFSGKYSGGAALRSVSMVQTPSSFVVSLDAGVLLVEPHRGTTSGRSPTCRLSISMAWIDARVPG